MMRQGCCANETLEGVGSPAGFHAILKRYERRIPATYRLGHDPSVPALLRLMARILSSYERAKARQVILILLDTLPVFDGTLLWLLRRAIFAMAGRPRGDDDPAFDMAVPFSGWAGNMLALSCWAVALACLGLAIAIWSPV